MKPHSPIPVIAGLITMGLTIATITLDAVAPRFSRAAAAQAQHIAQAAPPLTLIRSVGHNGASVNAVAFSRNGRWLATSSGDRRLRVWNVNALLQNDERNYLRAVIALPASDTYATSIAFGPGDRWLMTGTFNGDFRAWDLNACDPERPICASDMLRETDYRSVDANIAFNNSGTLLAGSNYDGTVTLWNWRNRSVVTVLEPETGRHDGSRLHGRFSSLAFAANGRYLMAGTHNQSITIWDFEEEFERALTIETTHGIEAIALNPDDGLLASAGLQGVELREIEYGRRGPVASEPLLLENPSRVRSLLFSPNGRYILAGDVDGVLKAWDIEEGRAIARSGMEQGHSKEILDITYDPVNEFYATASADGTVKLWRLR